MPAEEKVTTSGHYSAEEAQQKEPTTAPGRVTDRQLAHFVRLIQILMVISSAAIGFYLWLYLEFQAQQWQLLAEAGLVGVTLICLGFDYLLLRRQKTKFAGYLTLFGLMVAYGSSELLFSGATWYIALGGVFLIVLTGGVVLPRKWGVWFLAAVIYILYIGLIHWFDPVYRLDLAQLPWLSTFIPILTAIFALGILWQLISSFRIGTIRSRLLVAFTGVVLLTALLISLGAIYVGFENGREQVIDQLQAAAIFKQSEINTWTENLQTDLSIILSQPESSFRTLALLQKSASSEPTRQELRTDFERMMGLTGRFEEMFLLNRTGEVILSTDPLQEGKIYPEEAYFLEGLQGPYFHPPTYFPSLGQMSIIISRPVLSQDGEQPLGVLAGRANLDRLNEIMLERTGAGESGETYLVGSNKALLTKSRFPGYEPRETYVRTEGANAAIENHSNDNGFYPDYRGVPIIGVYRWLPDLQVALLSEQDQSEAFQPIYSGLITNVLIAMGTGFIAILLGLFVTGTISTPLAHLAQTATQIAAGDLDQEIKLERQDEIGEMAQAFNSMTTQLRQLIESLEIRVADRTQRLEIVAVLSERLSGILNLDELLAEVVTSVRNNFGYYHAHIYLLDERQETLAVAAGTGEAGMVMKASGHSIRVDAPTSLVARAARTGQIVRVDNVREAEGWLPNPLLPDTYSEMAVPIIMEGRVVGVLDVQENKVAGLDEGDASLLRSLANQVAVAIRNARLFAEVETALAEARAAHERYIIDSWQAGTADSRRQYHYTQPNAPMLAGSTLVEAKRRALSQLKPALIDVNARSREAKSSEEKIRIKKSIVAPITLRDIPVGALQLHPLSDDQSWTEEDLAVVEAIVDELAQTAENLRLFNETQERAGREQTIREITDKLRAAPSLDILLETAARELGQRLEVPHTVFKMGVSQPAIPDGNPMDGHENGQEEVV